MCLRLTPPDPQRGHVRQMASAPSTVEFCFRLRAAFVLHDYVSIVRHQIQEYIYETPLPTRSKCAMFRQHSLWIGNSVIKKRGRSPSWAPLWLVGGRVRPQVVGTDWCAKSSTTNARPLWMEAGCIGSERGLPWWLASMSPRSCLAKGSSAESGAVLKCLVSG